MLRAVRRVSSSSQGTIEELEETIARQNERMKEMEAEAEAECERLRDEGLEAIRKLRDAQEETDLKRETSRKLKEEIIDNDRLTVANLNRIKHLEALVDQHKAALDEVSATAKCAHTNPHVGVR